MKAALTLVGLSLRFKGDSDVKAKKLVFKGEALVSVDYVGVRK